jgi:hypothetical protein
MAVSAIQSEAEKTSFYSDDLQFAPPHFTVYDQPLRRFFVSSPYLNRIDVFDAAQEFQIGSIVVPFAWGIDFGMSFRDAVSAISQPMAFEASTYTKGDRSKAK